MNTVTQDQIVHEAVYISLCTDALGKGMNLSLLFTQAMSKK